MINDVCAFCGKGFEDVITIDATIVHHLVYHHSNMQGIRGGKGRGCL